LIEDVNRYMTLELELLLLCLVSTNQSGKRLPLVAKQHIMRNITPGVNHATPYLIHTSHIAYSLKLDLTSARPASFCLLRHARSPFLPLLFRSWSSLVTLLSFAVTYSHPEALESCLRKACFVRVRTTHRQQYIPL
jgi:hypothetical protein